MTVFDKAKEKKIRCSGWSKKRASLLAPSARGLRPQAVGERGPLKLKLHLFRQVCRGRIYASRAGYPLYRMIGTAAAGGIYAAPTSQPIIFILVYGRGRGMPRPYTCNRGKTHPHSSPLRISLSTPAFAGSGRYNKKRACDILYVTDSWCAVQDSNL